MSAIISKCGTYRYQLQRRIADYGLRTEYRGGSFHPYAMPGPLFLFIGVNPSTADAVKDDPTVKRWIGFTAQYEGVRIAVVREWVARLREAIGGKK